MKSDALSTADLGPLVHLEMALGPPLEKGVGGFLKITTPHASTTIPVEQLSLAPDTVVVFNDAKPLLKALLKSGISIKRSLCLHTLEKITFSPPLNTPPEGLKIFDRLDELLSAAEANHCNDLAKLECLVLPAFASLEHQGLHVDARQWLQAVSQKREVAASAAQKCEALLSPFTEKDLFGAAILNLNNPEEMRLLLQKALGKSIHGTGNEILEGLGHPLPTALLEYREASKLVSTYGDKFLEFVDPKTQRIHADFNALGAATGRVSCQRPNLQNLPSDPDFQRGMVAPAGRVLVHADFGACELRILAGLARDRNFLSAINSDEDFHSAVASQLFETRVSKSENPHLRDRAKAINFGIIYGMGPKGLARSLNIADDEASEILARYFSRFPQVRDFLEGCVSSAKQLGYAKTYHGRRLYFDGSANDPSFDISRIAKNMPIQGTAAELAKLAMIRVHDRLSADFENAFLVNMIHDELVVECDHSNHVAVANAMKAEMIEAQESLFANVRADVELSFVL